MIHFIVLYDQDWIIHNIKERVPDDLSSKIRLTPYEKLHHENSLRERTIIFTGINVITDVQREIWAEVWSQLVLAEPDILLMNHPQKALDEEIARLVKNGSDADDLLVVQCSHSADENGLYRKYSALKLGDSILPRYMNLSYNWVVKVNERSPPDGVLYDDATVEKELSCIRE